MAQVNEETIQRQNLQREEGNFLEHNWRLAILFDSRHFLGLCNNGQLRPRIFQLVDCGCFMKEVKICSNRGWNELTMEALFSNADAHEIAFMVAGVDYRLADVDASLGSSQLVVDREFKFHMLSLKKPRCQALILALDNWQATKSEFECAFFDTWGVQLTMGLVKGRSNPFNKEKPDFWFSYTDSASKIESRFQVDQSCIRAFSNGLSVLLEKY
jgi:hypothetical protein